MATTTQINEFITKVAPIVQKYCKAKGYKCASAIIAQACLESSYGTSTLGSKYHNYFGMKCGSSWKGASVNMNTKEEYKVGEITNITANFRVYSSMDEGIKGYFDFISTARYSNLKAASTPEEYLTRIKNDGYATDSSYVSKNMSVVTKYNLTKYDTMNVAETKVTTTSYYNKYTGTSGRVDEVLKAIGVPITLYGNVNKRKPIATANGIKNYSGTAEQNTKIVSLAKTGKLKKA